MSLGRFYSFFRPYFYMINNIIKILLLLSPIIYSRQISHMNVDFVFYVISIMALISVSFFCEKKMDFIANDSLLILFICCALNIFVHNMNTIIVGNTLNLFLAVIGIKTIVEYADNTEQCYKYILIAGLINCIIYAFEMHNFHPILKNVREGVDNNLIEYNGGIIGNTPRFTTYLSIISPVALYYSKFLYVILCGYCFNFAVIYSKEGNLLSYKFDPQFWALSCFVVIIFIMSNKHIKQIIFLSFVILLFYNYEVLIRKLLTRKDMYMAALYNFLYNPIKGTGLGILPEIFGKNNVGKDYTVCSSILQFIMQTGVLGLFFILNILNKFCKNINFKNINCIAIFAVIYMSIIEYPIEIKRVWFTIICFISFFIIDLTNRSLKNENKV